MSLTVRDLIAAARTRIREIQPVELLELQQFGCPIVDVREPDEFAEGHIPGAVNIPRGLLEFEVDGHPAVNYQTAEALLRLGFVNPMSLDHGILGWADAGHPVATPADAPPTHGTGLTASTCC